MISTSPFRSSGRIFEQWTCSICQIYSFKHFGNAFSTSSAQQTSRPLHAQVSLGTPKRNSFVNGNKLFSSSATVSAARTREPKLPDGPARTRFAPSPTGYLHIGGLRTAIFSYLLAKRTGGQFVLRIEDTDQKRLVPDAEAKIFEDLQWAGLEFDEGPKVGGPYGPYRQSERTQLYQNHAETLLNQDSAYRCFCSPQAASGGPETAYVTSGCYQNCSSLAPDESRTLAESEHKPFTVRLRNPEDAHKRTYPDLVYGKIQRLKRSPASPQPSASSEDGRNVGIDAADTVLIKSDGTPTYHFANVVDDYLMKITHVIRGAEWMASTPLHYDIYAAFGWKPPQFAHVGLLVDQNQAKLSKRNQDLALDVASMRDHHGVLPQPLNNFLALLGWSNPTDNDVMNMQELVENFDLKFTKGNAMVRTEKLWYLQKQHVAKKCLEVLNTNDLTPLVPILKQVAAEVCKVYSEPIINGKLTFKEHGDVVEDELSAYCADVLLADPKSYQNARQWVQRNDYFFKWDASKLPDAVWDSKKIGNITRKQVEKFVEHLIECVKWSRVSALPREVKGFEEHPAIEKLERQIHALIHRHIWRNVLRSYPMDTGGSLARSCPAIFDTKYDGTVRDLGYENENQGLAPNVDEDQLELSNEKIDNLLTIAEDIRGEPGVRANELARVMLSSETRGDEAEEELREKLESSFKMCNRAVMMYLRERLSYGQPGPSISWMMAVLGEDECRKRCSR